MYVDKLNEKMSVSDYFEFDLAFKKAEPTMKVEMPLW